MCLSFDVLLLLFVRECKIEDDGGIGIVLADNFLASAKKEKMNKCNFDKLVIRLAMLLFAKSVDQINKFEFVQGAARQQQREYNFLALKKLLDNEIKPLVIEIGCHINSNNQNDAANVLNQLGQGLYGVLRL